MKLHVEIDTDDVASMQKTVLFIQALIDAKGPRACAPVLVIPNSESRTVRLTGLPFTYGQPWSRIGAIKELRRYANIGLKEAKELLDRAGTANGALEFPTRLLAEQFIVACSQPTVNLLVEFVE